MTFNSMCFSTPSYSRKLMNKEKGCAPYLEDTIDQQTADHTTDAPGQVKFAICCNAAEECIP